MTTVQRVVTQRPLVTMWAAALFRAMGTKAWLRWPPATVPTGSSDLGFGSMQAQGV